VSGFNDKAGRELRPGDLIVYGHALGRCAGLRYGRILAVQPGKSSPESMRLRVQGVDDDTNWSGLGPRLCNPGTLSFEGRVLRVEREQVPSAVLSLLDAKAAQ
jgi:hypothetical protein